MEQFLKLIPLIIALVNLAERIFLGEGEGEVKKDFVRGGVESGARGLALVNGASGKPTEGWDETVGQMIDAVVDGQNISGVFSAGE